MSSIVLRLITLMAVVCGGFVLLALAIGQKLPPEDEIVYAANLDNADSEIYRMALNRQLTIALTRNTTEDSQPTWSPDGQEIAYVSNAQGGQFTIYLMDAQGGHVHPLNNNNQNNYSPAWSPDDRSIAYVTSRQEFAQQITEVLLTDLQSGLTRRITIPYPNAISPSWTPDSRHLAFAAGANGSPKHVIYSVDVQTLDTNPLIATNDNQLSPTWSPDGRYLLYLAYGAQSGMYLWDSQQDQSVLMFAPDVVNMRNPSWSPDSHYIIYAPSTTASANSILKLDVVACLQEKSRCAPEPITHGSGIYDNPRWRPRSS